MPGPSISVIVRARDEAEAIGRCLAGVGSQQGVGEVETIVVDSGSRDATVSIARRAGARVLTMPPGSFSFGGALNLGVADAHGELLVALSAHAHPPDERWLERLAAPFADPQVACVSGDRFDPDGGPLTRPLRQDEALARRRPEWGFSNAAGGVRAALWRRRGFRADLPGCEDKEWAWYWLAQGYVCVIDPAVVVDHDHTHDPAMAIYRRARREAVGMATFTGQGGPHLPELVREWWSDLRWYDSALRARLSHRRLARLLGTYAGRRQASRRRGWK